MDDRGVDFQSVDYNGNSGSEGRELPIRVRFRKTFNEKQLNYQVEAVFPKEISPKGTGFSGFWTKGTISLESLVIKKSSLVMQYNVWHWRGWK
ncbi:hypothetical protein ACX93W_09930 [Paenibacillus sp. CAU 1782]